MWDMRSPSHLLLVAAAFATAAGSFACGAPAASDTNVSEGELTGAARKGDEFVRCWTVSDGNSDDFFRDYTLSCRVSSKGLVGLAGSSVYVDASKANGSVVSGAPGDTPDHDVVLGHVHKSDFPLSLSVYGSWAAKRTDTISEFHLTVPAAEAANEAAPVIVKLPFDTWPVTFLNHGSFAAITTATYDVQAAPFITDQNGNGSKTTFSTSASTGAVRGPSATLDLLAPPSGGVSVEVQADHGSFRSTINAPGVYVIEGSSLRLATAEEEAAAVSGTAGGAGANAGPTGAGPASPSPPASPPTTTCGGPEQQHCTDNGNWSCNAGTRGDLDTGICLACGDDGETHCVNDPSNISGNWHCNAGTRANLDSGRCVACGAAGQGYCVDDPDNVRGNAVCNAGLNYDSNGICN